MKKLNFVRLWCIVTPLRYNFAKKTSLKTGLRPCFCTIYSSLQYYFNTIEKLFKHFVYFHLNANLWSFGNCFILICIENGINSGQSSVTTRHVENMCQDPIVTVTENGYLVFLRVFVFI